MTFIDLLFCFGLLCLQVPGLSSQTTKTCPAQSPAKLGPCVDTCSPTASSPVQCQSRELCCSTGCGFTCQPAIITNKSKIPNSGIFPIKDIYVVLIGMGAVILILFFIAIITLCCYSDARPKRKSPDDEIDEAFEEIEEDNEGFHKY